MLLWSSPSYNKIDGSAGGYKSLQANWDWWFASSTSKERLSSLSISIRSISKNESSICYVRLTVTFLTVCRSFSYIGFCSLVNISGFYSSFCFANCYINSSSASLRVFLVAFSLAWAIYLL